MREPNEGGSVTAVQNHEEDARNEFANVVEENQDENTVYRNEKNLLLNKIFQPLNQDNKKSSAV